MRSRVAPLPLWAAELERTTTTAIDWIPQICESLNSKMFHRASEGYSAK